MTVMSAALTPSPASIWLKSDSIDVPAAVLPSQWTVTTPSSEDNTGLDGTEHGVTSDSTVATTIPDHSPSWSLYVGTALTRTSICVPQSKPPKPSCVLSVTPAERHGAPSTCLRHSTRYDDISMAVSFVACVTADHETVARPCA